MLSAFPAGTRIIEARFARPEWLPCPVRVRVALPEGDEQTVFLRGDARIGGVETEARLRLPLHVNLNGVGSRSLLRRLGAVMR